MAEDGRDLTWIAKDKLEKRRVILRETIYNNLLVDIVQLPKEETEKSHKHLPQLLVVDLLSASEEDQHLLS